ncbi:hypothetical protein [Salinivirga cyanobacteriivorans]|uniref:Uncharacterized protein n=1 Tax=Salinivirga cyanobacteriivorans TaxID=1307839 RepID=A0A0S2HXI0_9BACT|nr:hypothetical protein [Salinivirga cyanobacteriivorans]ALO14749.1 hypothetical protein L21SP5_01085 [Salinivirga cyanobacteriivorans]
MKYLLIIPLFFIVTLSSAQPAGIMETCQNYFKDKYISDGQQYRALLAGEEVAEFHATFYEDNRYRLVACGARDNQTIVFNVYDKERNLLFSNKDYDNTPYWDLYFSSTTDCIIEARLDTNIQSSGIVYLLIGFEH